MKSFTSVLILVLFFGTSINSPAIAQRSGTKAVEKIKDEGYNNSRVMNILSYLTDVCGSRLTWSPEYKRAADWAGSQLREWGLENVRYDRFGPVGKGWTLRDFTLRIVEPLTTPLIAYPKAWSPSLKKAVADVVYLDVQSLDDFERFKGKLKGKFVLINEPADVKAHFEPEGRRHADSVLLRMANAAAIESQRQRRRGGQTPRMALDNMDSVRAFVRTFMPDADSARIVRFIREQVVGPQKLLFTQQEGALAALTVGRGDGGTIFVQQAIFPQKAGEERVSIFDPKAKNFIPQVALAAEHYNRMVRMIQHGQTVKLEMGINVQESNPDSGFSIIGEIPGTDLKDEIVMIGAHFDSWQAGTGATDNAAGSAVCMEAMRIIRKLITDHNLKPRRTIRIALWGGEEQGLFGSRAYVAKHLASRDSAESDLKTTPAYDRFSVYFNYDNGTGRIRGVYMQGNEAARPVFRQWLSELSDPTAQTLTLQNTGGTDHLPFDGAGLPGFQFIQDPVEYSTRTHHSNMDVFDRIQEEDVKQSSVVMALFAFNAASMDSLFPRKPKAPSRPQQVGSNE